MTRTHRDLRAWQQAMALVESVRALTPNLPADERFGLSSQIRRTVVSVPANFAEGFARNDHKE